MDNNTNSQSDATSNAARHGPGGFINELVGMVFDIVSGRADEREEARELRTNGTNEVASQDDLSDMPPLEPVGRSSDERRMEVDTGHNDMPTLLSATESESSDDDVLMDALLEDSSDEDSSDDITSPNPIVTQLQPASTVSNNSTGTDSLISPTASRPTRRPRVEDAADNDETLVPDPVAQFFDVFTAHLGNAHGDIPASERVPSPGSLPSRRRARVDSDDEGEAHSSSSGFPDNSAESPATDRDQRPIRPLPRANSTPRTPAEGTPNTNATPGNDRGPADAQELFRSILRTLFGEVPEGSTPNTPNTATQPSNTDTSTSQTSDTSNTALPQPQPQPQPQALPQPLPTGGVYIGVPGGPTIPLGTFNVAPEMMENVFRRMGGHVPEGEQAPTQGAAETGPGDAEAPTQGQAPSAAASPNTTSAPANAQANAGANTPVNPANPANEPNGVDQIFEDLFALFGTTRANPGGGGPGGFMFPMGMGMFGEPEKDDPERAKRLINGLEIVPKGLVRRLERVGGAPGAHEESATQAGDVMCAVCWDTLLDEDGTTWESEKKDGAVSEEGQGREQDTAPVSQQQAESTEAPAEAPTETPSEGVEGAKSTELPEHPKIVSLPCAHVFHASCLKPWFSRPGQTTCPVCRFNIDPENLTYRFRPSRRMGLRPDFRTGPHRTATAPVQLNPDAAGDAPADGATTTTNAQAANNSNVEQGAQPQTQPQPQIHVHQHHRHQHRRPRTFSNFFFNGGGPPMPNAPNRSPVFSINLDVIVNMPIPPADATQDATQNQANGGNATTPTPASTATTTPSASSGEQQPPAAAGGNTQGAQNAGDANGNATQDANANTRANVPPRNLFTTFINSFNGPMPATGQGPAVFPMPMGPMGPMPMGGFGMPGRPRPGFPRPMDAQFQPHSHFRRQPPPPRRDWTLPPPPGLTLRQRVEKKEREAGLRCSDISCGFGPTDEDPTPDVSAEYMTHDASTMPKALHQVAIRAARGDAQAGDLSASAVCEHRFHPACLVSVERVNGWVRSDEIEREPGVEVGVECPVCKADGFISREEWEEGVKALM